MYSLPAQVTKGQTLCKVWLASVERRRCSNEAKTRQPLKLAGVPQTSEKISAANFFPIVDTCLSCEDIALQRCYSIGHM